jgi:hypothetical protein
MNTALWMVMFFLRKEVFEVIVGRWYSVFLNRAYENTN